MAGANKTFANWKNAKWTKVFEEAGLKEENANNLVEELKKTYSKVKKNSYKFGPKNKPITKYVVRAYEVNN